MRRGTDIEHAVRVLAGGGLVAFPTETVYGLGADARAPEAVERISALLVPGSSLIASDNALSDETDADTDFIVLTP